MSRICWTERTWNVVTGCTPCSPGCAHCYAARLASGRLKHHKHYAGLAERGKWTGEVRLNADLLDAPLHRRKPTVYFVASTGDLFHPDVPPEFITMVWDVMADCPRHTFLVLTKRASRLTRLIEWRPELLPNVWLGVSASNQDEVGRKVPLLLAAPAARRFVSLEPLLGPVDMCEALHTHVCTNCGAMLYDRTGEIEWPESGEWSVEEEEEVCGTREDGRCGECGHIAVAPCGDVLGVDVDGGDAEVRWRAKRHPRLDGVIVGCESGPGRRPMEPDWARSVRDQCAEAGVAFTLKQAVIGGKLFHVPPLDGVTHNAFPWALVRKETEHAPND